MLINNKFLHLEFVYIYIYISNIRFFQIHSFLVIHPWCGFYRCIFSSILKLFLFEHFRIDL